MENEHNDLKPLMKLMSTHRWLIVKAFFGTAIAGLAYTLVIPAVWRANVILLIPMPTITSTATTPTGQSVMSSLLGNSTGPLPILAGVVTSHTVLAPVAKEAKMGYYDFLKVASATPNVDSNQLQISVLDTSKKNATKWVTSIYDKLTQLDIDLNLSLSKERMKTFEVAVKDKTQAVEDGYKDIIDFEAKTLTAPEADTAGTGSSYVARLKDIEFQLEKANQQMKAAKEVAHEQAAPSASVPTGIPEVEKYRQQIVDLEAQLRTKLQSLGPANPDVVKLTQQIEVTKSVVQERIGKYLQSIDTNVDSVMATLVAQIRVLEWQREYLVKMAKVAPIESSAFQKLMLELVMRQDILKLVRQQYEQAKLDAEVDPIRWQLLAAPYVEEQPTNKRYILNTGLGGFLGILVGLWLSKRKERIAELGADYVSGWSKMKNWLRARRKRSV